MNEPYESGITQGDSLSPLLLDIVMDEIIKNIKIKKGYRMCNRELKIICYADDAIIMAETENDLLIRILYSSKTIEKTKTIVTAKEQQVQVDVGR